MICLSTFHLIDWLNSYAVSGSSSVLIQVFSGVLDLEIMYSVTQTILDVEHGKLI